MPTDLPARRKPRPDIFILFLVAFAAAIVAIEFADPAPMDVEAAWVASP